MLADARREDERVETARCSSHRRHGSRDAVGVDAERELRLLVVPSRRLERTKTSSSGQALEPRLLVQGPVDLVDGQAVRTLDVEERAGIDRARARRHRHALERREAHRRVDGAPVAHRRDRATAAEVTDDEAEIGLGAPQQLGRPLRSTTATESPWKP